MFSGLLSQALTGSHGERSHEAYALHLLGDVATLEGRAAAACYEDSARLASELGMRPLVAHCHLGLGKLYSRAGDRAKAGDHLAIATTMYREMDMTFYLAQAETALRERA